MIPDGNISALPRAGDTGRILGRQLTVKEREGIESHLAYCDDCRELVALVVKARNRDAESY